MQAPPGSAAEPPTASFDFDLWLAEYRMLDAEARDAAAKAEVDEALKAAKDHADKARAAYDALLAPYRAAISRVDERIAVLKLQVAMHWPDATKKTLKGPGWEVQRRVTETVVVRDQAAAIRFFSDKGLLHLAVKDVKWDPAYLKNARATFGPGSVEGRRVLDVDMKTAIAVKLDQEAA